MSITTHTRRSTHSETAAEMDRRGKIIARLEEELRQTKIHRLVEGFGRIMNRTLAS